MIKRYIVPPFDRIWSDKNKFETWLKVERAALQVLEKHRLIDEGSSRAYSKIKISPEKIYHLESKLKHDVIAFTAHVTEQVNQNYSRVFHFGLTSSDVVDTSLSLLLLESSDSILEVLNKLISILKKLSLRYKSLPSIGRTHGMHGEPTSFGLKFLSFYCEFVRNRDRFIRAIENIKFGKISGAVGAYGVLNRKIEKEILDTLELRQESVSTQVIPRDRHLEFISVINHIACSLERLSIELRHLQRTEVGEIEEGFDSGQKGSSAMPHKKNPISAENITGCSRLIKGYLVSAFDNVALWHERDISHSSVERVIMPDSTTLIYYMLCRMNVLLNGIRINDKNIKKNIDLTHGAFYSGGLLLECVNKGISRETAYALIQKAAHNSMRFSKGLDEELFKNKIIQKHFSKREWTGLFKVDRFLKNVDDIYKDVLK